METVLRRYFAALLAFGFVAVWAAVGFLSAILCLAGSAVPYVATAVKRRGGVRGVAQRARTEPAAPARTRQPPRRGPVRSPEDEHAPPLYDGTGDDLEQEWAPQPAFYGW
jgi:hypothetical protein